MFPGSRRGAVAAAMKWIRNPLWDGFWIFGSLPLGVAFAAGVVPWVVIVHGFIVVNTAHLLAPIVLAWTHRGLQPIMLERKVKFVVVPALIMLAGVVPGWLCCIYGYDIDVNQLTLAVRFRNVDDIIYNPLGPIVTAYFIWNIYHFSMQNYGLLRIYRPDMDKATAMQIMMFSTIILLIVVPEKYGSTALFLFIIGAVMFNHQLAALGLASHIWSCHHGKSMLLFTVPLLLLGGIVSFATVYLIGIGRSVLIIIAARYAMGFVHFLYDRWIYKFSNPCIRATIGHDMLGRNPV